MMARAREGGHRRRHDDSRERRDPFHRRVARLRAQSAGGSVFIFARSGGMLTGYSHGWKYGATDAAFALGRVVDSTGAESLVPLAAPTPGVFAATPQIGPVIINEIWYHPPVGLFEAVELRNIGASAVALDGWRLDGFAYTFPAASSIAAGGYALVVADDPAAFRARHNVPAATPIFGVAPGTLENSGERLSLERPSTLTSGVFVILESVRYNDKAPWPVTADGSGPSLQRISGSVLALEPTNWQGLGLTLGRANTTNTAPTVAITAPAHLRRSHRQGAFTVSVDAMDADGQSRASNSMMARRSSGRTPRQPYSLALSNVVGGRSLAKCSCHRRCVCKHHVDSRAHHRAGERAIRGESVGLHRGAIATTAARRPRTGRNCLTTTAAGKPARRNSVTATSTK
jgi:hypothetical protein